MNSLHEYHRKLLISIIIMNRCEHFVCVKVHVELKCTPCSLIDTKGCTICRVNYVMWFDVVSTNVHINYFHVTSN